MIKKMKGFHRTHSIAHHSDPAAGTPPKFFSFEQTKNPKPKPHLSLLVNSIPPTTANNNLVKTPPNPTNRKCCNRRDDAAARSKGRDRASELTFRELPPLRLGEVLLWGAGVGEEQRTAAPPISSSSTSAAMGGGGDEEAGNTAAATAPSTPSSSAALGGGGDEEAGGTAAAMAVGEVGKCRRRWRGRQRRLDSKWKGENGLRIAVEAGRESGVVRGA
jgi:hypothetical protein